MEIILSLTENKEIKEISENLGIKYLIVPKDNLSITSNLCFKDNKYNKVVISNSDTIFEKRCIKKFNNALEKF